MTIHHHLDRDAGAPGVTSRLAEQYLRAGHDVEMISFDDLPRGLPPKVRPLLFPAFVATLVRPRLRAGAIDVIDASSGDSALLDRASRSLRHTVLVVRSHGLEHNGDRRLRAEAAAGQVRLSWRYPVYHGGYRLREVARAMRRADVNLVLNKSDRHLAIHELGVDPARVHVVSNGVPERLVRRGEACARQAGRSVDRVVQLGSYVPMKGIHYGRLALAALLTRHPEMRAAFLGTGCARERVLADFAPAFHPRIDVVERYRNDDLDELLRPTDVNLLPTLTEGFGLAALEAMARGVPSVVTATPGPAEFCQDGVNALVVQPGDAQALYDALQRLIGNSTLRERLARAAVAAARERTWPRVAALNLAVYERHLADKCAMPVSHPLSGDRTGAPVVHRGTSSRSGRPAGAVSGPDARGPGRVVGRGREE